MVTQNRLTYLATMTIGMFGGDKMYVFTPEKSGISCNHRSIIAKVCFSASANGALHEFFNFPSN